MRLSDPKQVTRVSGRRRAALASLVAAAAVVSWFVPGPLGAPLRRLANEHADPPDPLWNVPVDSAAMRGLRGRLHRGDTYFVQVPNGQAQLRHDVSGGAYLFLSPALRVQSRDRAGWLLIASRDGAVRLVRR